MTARRSTLLYPILLVFLLQAHGAMAQDASTPAPAEPAVTLALPQVAPTSPAEVAREFVARVVKHDHLGAAELVTDESRADFLQLMELSDRLRTARAELQSAVDGKFRGGRAAAGAPPAAGPAPNSVLGADVSAQRQIDANTIELTMRLYTVSRTRPVQDATWRAVQEHGKWKIELPQCAAPGTAAALKQWIRTMIDADKQVTASIHTGGLATLGDVRTALIAAERKALPLREGPPIIRFEAQPGATPADRTAPAEAGTAPRP
jgi:hypothetical protein